MSKRNICDEKFLHRINMFYRAFFPVTIFMRWMGALHCSENRDITFKTLEGYWNRYSSLSSEKEIYHELLSSNILTIHVGAVYVDKPGREGVALGKELVFDIDITDYDSIRTCCKGRDHCNDCWQILEVTRNIIDRKLRDNFGFTNLMWVFSGGRGIHCWVLDKRTFKYDEEVRASICSVLSEKVISPEVTEGFTRIQCLNIESPLELGPRLDINVTTSITHLTKSPFCVHPDTGYVCVPINPDIPFLPSMAPTIDSVEKSNGDVLIEYLGVFRSHIEDLCLQHSPPSPYNFDT